MTMSTCRECKGTVSPNAQACPHCGAPMPARADFRGWGFDWRSKTTLLGLPLVHVSVGLDKNRRLRVARGWIAIGQFAIGLLTVAQCGIGIVGIGQFILGWFVLAHFAAASIASVGQFASGALLCVGQLAIGSPVLGQLEVSVPSRIAWPVAIAVSISIASLLRARLKLAVVRPPPAPARLAGFLAAPTLSASAHDTVQSGSAASVACVREPDASPTLEPGATLGPYRVVELLGRGGMGVVYRAEHRLLARTVALKVLRPKLAQDPQFIERFKREAQALAKLRHPHIVSLYDMGEEAGVAWFTMEYVDGTDLRSVLRAKALAPEQALRLIPKLCDGLEYAHRQGVVHRDVKPENVLLGKDGEPRIADFGLARLIQPDGRPPALTETGATMGTPDYMAPEQRAGAAKVDHRADIYSLGVVLYEMLTGELPLGRFDPPAKKVEVDVRIDSVVLRALEQDRERRYARAEDMGSEIRKISACDGVKMSDGLGS